jgi:hypothetical protein
MISICVISFIALHGAQRTSSGTAAFVVQFRVGRGRLAKRRRVVLGEYPAMTPEQAREQAVMHISAGWRGDDPVAEKRAQQATQARQRDTVKQSEAFHAARRPHLHGRSADQYQSLWRRLIIPDLGGKAVSDLKHREIANLMDRIERSTGTSVADRVHLRMRPWSRRSATPKTPVSYSVEPTTRA